MESEVLVAIVGGGFTVINAIVSAIIGAVNNRKTNKAITDMKQTEEITQLKRDVDAMKEGLLSILRDNIITMHERQSGGDGIPLYMRDALEHSYNAYKALGGNGTVTALYNELMGLPIERREENYHEN